MLGSCKRVEAKSPQPKIGRYLRQLYKRGSRGKLYVVVSTRRRLTRGLEMLIWSASSIKDWVTSIVLPPRPCISLNSLAGGRHKSSFLVIRWHSGWIRVTRSSKVMARPYRMQRVVGMIFGCHALYHRAMCNWSCH